MSTSTTKVPVSSALPLMRAIARSMRKPTGHAQVIKKAHAMLYQLSWVAQSYTTSQPTVIARQLANVIDHRISSPYCMLVIKN